MYFKMGLMYNLMLVRVNFELGNGDIWYNKILAYYHKIIG